MVKMVNDMIVKPGIPENLRWFYDARFGMFVHFGMYALLGRGEWVMYNENIPKYEYLKLMERFNPSEFDAEEWVDLAYRAGAGYITFTTRHHDGFCMFDSAYTEYKITNTPYGRDFLRELSDACHRRNMPLVLYYSQPDWTHVNYVHNAGAFKDLTVVPEDQEPDWPKFQEFIYNQLEELCTKYGKIAGVFFDGSHKTEADWRGKLLYDMIKRHQPDAVVNDRARCGDYYSPERAAVTQLDPELAGNYLLEICNSVTKRGWGYFAGAPVYSAVSHVESMVRAARIGCNYLLNVGPYPSGAIPADQREAFEAVGSWMRRHSEGYVATRPVEIGLDREKYVTLARDGILYIFCLEYPRDELTVDMPGAAARSVRLLETGEYIRFRQEGDEITLRGFPVVPPSPFIQALRVEFYTKPEFGEMRYMIPIKDSDLHLNA